MVRWLREHDGLGRIIFEDLGLEFVMRFDRAVEVGERLTICVSYADPRQEMIRFKEVITATEQEETVDIAEQASPETLDASAVEEKAEATEETVAEEATLEEALPE